ncbi:MAG: chemotaxis protein CheA [Tepidisphaeraceae bacterium]|jgi:two-component system chemotaxis sensor kinase CheA
MRRLTQLTEEIAAAVVSADVDDPHSLAGIHSQFEELAGHAKALKEQGNRSAGTICSTATDAGQILAKIILRETDDTTKLLKHVTQAVARLQEMARRAGEGGDEAGADSDAREELPVLATGELTGSAPVAAAEPGAASPEPGGSPDIGTSIISADDAPLVAEFVGEARGHIESAEAGVLQVEEHPDDLEAINAIFRAFHTIKGVAGFLNLKQIGSLSHAAENVLDLGRKGELKLVGKTVDVILASIDLMKTLITGLEQAMKQGTPLAPESQLPGLLEQLHACAAGERVEETRVAAASAAVVTDAAASPAAAPAAGAGSAGGPAATSSGETSVKVATDRLDSLINMVGELVIAESMVHQDIIATVGNDQRLARNVSHLGKITRALQGLSMSMRMVPIHGVFQKMARLVRDLGRKACKEIEFAMTGGETELDRNVVEAIGDPLVHMVRNSVDHGIEPPDVREKAGKPRAGRVELKAYHQGGSIVIQISDDGRGLNKQKLLDKAMENGIVKEGQELTEQEIFALIFHAGLSTAEKVTDVSGRGVGMDVVKRNIEGLRGRIDISSTEGKGSTFTIKLPLTLAVIDGLVVKVGRERYILPLTSIEQSLRPTAEQISTLQGRGEMCLMRGSLLPLFRLHRLFEVQPRHENPTDALVVIVQDNQRRCCLMVDEIIGQQQVVIKSLGEVIGRIKGVSGGAILGDGSISLILDVPGLINAATES